jgi:hypothetical protein
MSLARELKAVPRQALTLPDAHEVHESRVESGVLFETAFCQVIPDLDLHLFDGHGPVLFIMSLIRLTIEFAAFLARLDSHFHAERIVELESE